MFKAPSIAQVNYVREFFSDIPHYPSGYRYPELLSWASSVDIVVKGDYSWLIRVFEWGVEVSDLPKCNSSIIWLFADPDFGPKVKEWVSCAYANYKKRT